MDITNTALIYIGAGCHNLRELDVYRLVCLYMHVILVISP
jgi:hypothetical protein